MLDRLVELINEAKDEYPTIPSVNCCKPTFAYYLAHHLLANGAILPPCKVGDTVWFELYGQIESAVVYHCTCELSRRGCVISGAYAKDTRGLELSFDGNSIGKTVFLTREEAEQALNGGDK